MTKCIATEYFAPNPPGQKRVIISPCILINYLYFQNKRWTNGLLLKHKQLGINTYLIFITALPKNKKP